LRKVSEKKLVSIGGRRKGKEVINGLRRWPTKYSSTLSFCVSRRLLQKP